MPYVNIDYLFFTYTKIYRSQIFFWLFEFVFKNIIFKKSLNSRVGKYFEVSKFCLVKCGFEEF